MKIKLSEVKRIVREAVRDQKFAKFVCAIYQDRDEFANPMPDWSAYDSWPDEQNDPNIETREFRTREEAIEWGKSRTRELNLDDESIATYRYAVGIRR